MRNLLRSFVLLVLALTSMTAQAELYLGVRPAYTLGAGESRGGFVGGWDRVLLNVDEAGQTQVLSLTDIQQSYGSVLAASRLARANTAAVLSALSYEEFGPVTQIIARPPAAVSGLLLLPDFADLVREDLIREDLVREDRGLETLKFILPLGDLLILQTDLNPALDQAFASLATRIATADPAGLDDQVLGYAGGQYSLIDASTRPPTQEEILMSLGQDPENTLVITLKDGDVVIRLRDDVAPNHVARIKELAREGFYDGIVFHRVIEGFMAQTGDPTGTGTSGSGQKLNAEFSEAPFLRGTVGMARAQSPNSADSQFFIMFADGRFLDNNYTVIGQVATGMDFVDQIKRGEPPADPDRMIKVQVQADL